MYHWYLCVCVSVVKLKMISDRHYSSPKSFQNVLECSSWKSVTDITLLTSCFKRFQKVPEGSRRFQKVSGSSRRSVCLSIFKLKISDRHYISHKSFQVFPECVRMFQNVPEGSRRFQKVPEVFRRFQKVSEGFRRFQKVPEGSRRFQNACRWVFMQIADPWACMQLHELVCKSMMQAVT